MKLEQIVTLVLMILNAAAGAIVAAKPESLGLSQCVQSWVGIGQIAIGTALGFLKSVTNR